MIFYSSTAVTDGTAVGLVLDIPAGSAVDDYAIVAFIVTNSGDNAYTFQSGWTKIADPGTGDAALRIFGKQLTSGDITLGYAAITFLSPPGTGFPVTATMIVAHATGGTALRSMGTSTAQNFQYSTVATTNTGELIPPGPYSPPPQIGDWMLSIAGGYSPQGLPRSGVSAPPAQFSIAVPGLLPILVGIINSGEAAFGSGAYQELLIPSPRQNAAAGEYSITGDVIAIGSGPPITAVNGIGVAILAFYPLVPTPPSPTPTYPPGAWLIINEPATGSPPTGGGYTDRTPYLFLGEGHQNNFTNQLRQRGQATIHLIVKNGDPYTPTRGTQIFLYDQIGSEFVLNFSGLIQNIENQYISNKTDHFVIINAVSFESLFDTVLTTIPSQYFEMTAGDIFTALFNAFETGCPITLGNIQPGVTIQLLNTNFNKISDLFDQLATASEYIWGVNPQTLELYFQPPFVTPAPFTLTTPNVSETGFGPGWGTVNWKQVGQDYRNRQCIRLSPSAFTNSQEFFVGAGQINFTLLRPVDQVVNAWVTTSTPNFASGTFTGNPSPGDTITIEYIAGTSGVGWLSGHTYNLGGIIIDPAGYVQKVTSAGVSGGSTPPWNDVTGGFTPDNTVEWTCQGPAGLGTNTKFVYTFVSVLDNTQFGQILIGATYAETANNFVEALNAVIGDNVTFGQGIDFSLPTWENGIVNASLSGLTVTVTNKPPGTGYVASLSASSSAFAWAAANTSGGSSPQTSVGPNEGATITIAVGVLGTTIGGPGLAYTPGSATVSLVTPLNVGTNLSVEYTRAGGDVIQCENTSLVKALAAISHGTGKYQAIVDYSSSIVTVNAADALTLAQQIIAAYSYIPQRVTFDTYQPGLLTGQALTISLTLPTGATGLVNGVWVIEEINAEIVPCVLDGLCPGIGHYKYTVSVVDIQEIGSFLDFWEGLGGGGGGSGEGSVSALVASGGGGSLSPVGQGLVTGGVNEQTSDYTAVVGDNGKLIVLNGSGSPGPTLKLPPTPPSNQWNIFVENIGASYGTIDPNGLDLDGSGSDLRLLTNEGVYITTDGTNYFTERGLVAASTPVTSAVRVGYGQYGLPANGAVSLFPAPVNGTFPANFAGSFGAVQANPTSTAVYTIFDGATQIGTVTISTAGAFTFATTGSAIITFSAGDQWSIVAPSPQDATLSGVTFVLVGVET